MQEICNICKAFGVWDTRNVWNWIWAFCTLLIVSTLLHLRSRRLNECEKPWLEFIDCLGLKTLDYTAEFWICQSCLSSHTSETPLWITYPPFLHLQFVRRISTVKVTFWDAIKISSNSRQIYASGSSIQHFFSQQSPSKVYPVVFFALPMLHTILASSVLAETPRTLDLHYWQLFLTQVLATSTANVSASISVFWYTSNRVLYSTYLSIFKYVV